MLLSVGTTESGIVCSICTHNRHLSFSPNLTQVRECGVSSEAIHGGLLVEFLDTAGAQGYCTRQTSILEKF